MTVVGKDILEEMVYKSKIIHPFDPDHLDGDGYILTVNEDSTLNYQEHKNLIAHEIVFVPHDFVAHLTAKSKYGRMGISFLNAVKVHSGWVGRLELEVVNLNNERRPIEIENGKPFMHIEFERREGKPSPYKGEYMFQHMTKEEIDKYIEIMLNLDREIYDEDYLLKYKTDVLRKTV